VRTDFTGPSKSSTHVIQLPVLISSRSGAYAKLSGTRVATCVIELIVADQRPKSTLATGLWSCLAKGAISLAFFKLLTQKLSFLLAPRWVGRLLLLVAFGSSTAVLSLTAAVHFGYLAVPDAPSTLSADLSTDAGIADDDASSDETLVDADIEIADSSNNDEDEDSDDSEDIADYEVPEYLNPEVEQDPIVISALTGVLDDLLLTAQVDEEEPSFDRDWVLNDADKRVSEDFKIPSDLRDRVGFWFDVYTKYDSNRRVIHHSLYPWIVYKVIDVTPVINAETPRHLWLRRQKADRLVKEEALKIRAGLSRIAKTKNLKNLRDVDQALAEKLTPLGGDIRKQALLALRSVRVQTGQKDFFAEGLRVSSRYLGTMEKIFEKYKLPYELTRIPLVESSFNRRATSKVGAAGIWQFMGNTGSKFMMVSSTIDERRSPFKATEAAAHLLKENHMILYRSWPLAVTAWNHGPTGLRKAVNRAGSRELGKIIARYRSRSFDFASSNFYTEFLGALYAERYSEEVFGGIERAPHIELQVVKLSRSVRATEILKVSGLTLEDFLAINPELSTAVKRNLLIPRGFRLHIPESAIENLQKFFAFNRERPTLKSSAKRDS
jgi:membrane-bound lytic murein transglycosylase D